MPADQAIFKKILAQKDKYFCWVARPATMQRLTLLVRAFYKAIGTEIINFRGQGRDLAYYFKKDKYRQASLALARKLGSDKAINRHFVAYRKYKNRLLEAGRKATKVRADRKELLKLFRVYERAMLDFTYYLISPFFVDDYIFPDLADKLKNILPPQKCTRALEIISTPTIVFGYQKYYQELGEAKKAADFARLARKYKWIKEYSFQEKLLDARAAQIDQKELSAAGLLKAAKAAPHLCRQNQQALKKLLAGLADAKIKRQIRLVHDYINVKTERIEAYKIFQADFRQFFYQLLELVKERQPAAKYEDVISSTDEEILAFLKSGRKINLNITKRRYDLDFVSVGRGKQMVFTYDKDLIRKIRQAFMSAKGTKEIIGLPVSRGQAKGRVKLIIHRADLAKIKSGEILVSSFTMPDYVPAMKKAAGIITDDGGITSHAAIISRELGKPCVTGTKIATQILKDGDWVEMDAEKGIVKIIKK